MINIYSTFAEDFIYSNNNKLVSRRKGGPAFFIENFFKRNDVKYKLFTGNIIEIKIQVSEKGEAGIIESNITTKFIPKEKQNGIILISTISNEWMPDDDFTKGCKIFLDIQGYVRAARNGKSIFKSSFWKNVFCMKGTLEEIGLMPDDIVESQKDKLLIITNGSKGCDIFFKKNIYKFSPKNIIKTKDAIGAGDTFFAGFISEFVHTNDIIKSGNLAVCETEKFLASKDNE